MSYAESLLTPDEKVLVRERQHWLALILDSWLAIIFWGATVVLIIIQLFLPEELFGQDLFGEGTWFGTLAYWATVVTVLGGIIVVAIRWWWWRTQEFIVTTRRLVLAWGILNKSSSDSSLEKINDAQLEISVLGRILDYGSLRVLTAAPLMGADLLQRLHHAKAFKKAMMTAKHNLLVERGDGEGYGVPPAVPAAPSAAPMPPPPATPTPAATGSIDVSGGADPLKADTPDEVVAVLGQLTAMRDAGQLSSEDYEAKKRELLDRL